MSAALKLLPGADPRAAAVAKFREIADRIESGELRGGRIQWREGLEYCEIVECYQAAAEDPGLPMVRLYHWNVAGFEQPLPPEEERKAREEAAFRVLFGR